jgi:hypothetical protein
MKKQDVRDRLFKITSNFSESQMEEPSHAIEEREHARKDLSFYAHWWLGDIFYRDYILNISAGGLFIETKIPVIVGETVTVSFSPSDNEDPIKVEGKIVRVEPNGFGVKFNEPLTTLLSRKPNQ